MIRFSGEDMEWKLDELTLSVGTYPSNARPGRSIPVREKLLVHHSVRAKQHARGPEMSPLSFFVRAAMPGLSNPPFLSQKRFSRRISSLCATR